MTSRSYLNILVAQQFFKIPLAGWATAFPNNLALYLKNLKLSVFATSLSKSVALSLEQNHILPVVSQQIELYSVKLYIGMTKSKSSASSIGFPLVFVIHFCDTMIFLFEELLWH